MSVEAVVKLCAAAVPRLTVAIWLVVLVLETAIAVVRPLPMGDSSRTALSKNNVLNRIDFKHTSTSPYLSNSGSKSYLSVIRKCVRGSTTKDLTTTIKYGLSQVKGVSAVSTAWAICATSR